MLLIKNGKILTMSGLNYERVPSDSGSENYQNSEKIFLKEKRRFPR